MKPAKRPRLAMPAVSEQMKAWSAALAEELTGWPQVETRTFFGFTALYRGEKIFALVPRSRAMGTPNTLAFKFESLTPRLRTRLERDRRVGTTEMRASRWQTFELSSNSDLHDALDWLGLAYDAAGKTKKSR
jgi:TfoX/Sxy family transcriptional regulator of competence genes